MARLRFSDLPTALHFALTSHEPLFSTIKIRFWWPNDHHLMFGMLRYFFLQTLRWSVSSISTKKSKKKKELFPVPQWTIFFGSRQKGDVTVVAVMSSGILKAKQKLGIIFNSDKLGGIDFTKFSKLTMCLGGSPGHHFSKNLVCKV